MNLTNVTNQVNQTISNPNRLSPFIVNFLKYLGIASNWLTQKIMGLFLQFHIQISQVGAGLILSAIIIGIFLLVLKVAKGILKWVFIGILVFLILGLFIPVY